MAIDLVQIRQQAENKEDENLRFRRFLKTKSNLEQDEIDRRVFAATQRVWAGIDCTKCANCCREVKPGFSEEEVDRLALRLAMSRQGVYEDRPAECRGYPYLYEPEFVSRTLAMIGRTFTCPIVYEVMEELKSSLGFLRR